MDRASSLLTNWRRVHSNGLLQSPWEKQKAMTVSWNWSVAVWPASGLGLRRAAVSTLTKMKREKLHLDGNKDAQLLLRHGGLLIFRFFWFRWGNRRRRCGVSTFPPPPSSWSWSGQKIPFETSRWWFWRLEATRWLTLPQIRQRETLLFRPFQFSESSQVFCFVSQPNITSRETQIQSLPFVAAGMLNYCWGNVWLLRACQKMFFFFRDITNHKPSWI